MNVKDLVKKKMDKVLEKKQTKLPILHTVFGKHSQSYGKLPILHTNFGRHSGGYHDNNEDLLEDTIPRRLDIDELQALHNQLKYKHNYTKPEAKSIKDYTSGSKEINSSLHDLAEDRHAPISEHVKEKLDDLDSATSKHALKAPLHVFTGLSRGTPMHTMDKEGVAAKIHLPAYTSSSIDFQKARSFATPDIDWAAHTRKSNDPGVKKSAIYKHVLHLELPRGSKHGGYIDHHSAWGDHSEGEGMGEKEFLIGRNKTVHIMDHTVDHPNKTVVWHGKIED